MVVREFRNPVAAVTFGFRGVRAQNGGRDRTRTVDLLRVKHYGLVRFIEASGTEGPVLSIFIV